MSFGNQFGNFASGFTNFAQQQLGNQIQPGGFTPSFPGDALSPQTTADASGGGNTTFTNPNPAGSGASSSTGSTVGANPFGFENAFDPMMEANPGALVAAYYAMNGFDPYAGGYANMKQYAQAMPLLNFILGGNKQGFNDYFNFAQNYLNQGLQNGGQPGNDAIWSALFNTDPTNPLYNYIHDPSKPADQQVSNVLSAIRYGLQNTMTPTALNALMSRTNLLGEQYVALKAQNAGGANDPGTFTDFMTANGMGAGFLQGS